MKSITSAARRYLSFIFALMLLATLASSFSVDAKAEIPHENYELISSDIEVVIALLNSSIRASEMALIDMYNESMPDVEQHLNVVTGILEPAHKLLDKISGLAESYSNISSLLPPFVKFSDRERSFADMEYSLIDARAKIASYRDIQNLTGENLTRAIADIDNAYSLIARMNNTIDDMLVSASDINNLTIDGRKPFAENNLLVLIEKLRDLLRIILAEIEDMIHNEIPWNEAEPFLTLWVADMNLHLGDRIQGGGYIFFNGSFQSGIQIRIALDSADFLTSISKIGGTYNFAFNIPINISWLGSHALQAFSFTGFENLSSGIVVISISLIPTVLRISTDMDLLDPGDDLTISAHLEDIYGNPLAGADCALFRDDIRTEFITDYNGEFDLIWEDSEISYGTHSINASYYATLPYESSNSNVVWIVKNVLTTIELNLFENRFLRGFYLVGNGSLYANSTQPLAGQNVTIFIDGVEVQNITTQPDGSFSFSFETFDLNVGVHSMKAALVYKDSIWRFSEDSEVFTIFVQERTLPYPFFPFIPGWGGVGGIGDLIDLFFGAYAYFTWMLMLLVLSIIIRAWQISKKRKSRPRETGIGAMETVAFASGEKETGGTTQQTTGTPPSDPNRRIVWYYNRLIRTLIGDHRISIADSMTHWEVARLLDVLGYPLSYVNRATMLFERAFYSGARLSDSDAEDMTTSISQIESVGIKGAGDAV